MLITASGRQKNKVFTCTIISKNVEKKNVLDKRLQKRLDESPCSHVKDENVYIENSELLVCAVHTQHQSSLNGRKQREYHSCHEVKIESVLGYKSLDAMKVKLPFDRSWHCRRKLMEISGFVPYTWHEA